MENKKDKVNIFKAVVIVAALIIAYLFALNGRYHCNDGKVGLVYDKWTRTCLKLGVDGEYYKYEH